MGVFWFGSMNKTKQGKAPDLGKGQPQPRIREAIVQCEGFRCWARQNAKGEWLDWHGNKLKVIEVVTVLG